MSHAINKLIRFGEFCLDVRNRQLWHQDDPIALTPKAFDLLTMLVSRPGEIIKKEILIKELWTGSDSGANSLSQTVHLLRKALRQYGAENVIVTIQRRGYRFVGEVSKTDADMPDGHEPPIETLTAAKPEHDTLSGTLPSVIKRPRKSIYTALSVFTTLIVGIAAIYLWISNSHSASTAGHIRSIAVLPFKSLDGLDENLGIRMADSIITRINRLDHVNVRPTSSITRFSNHDADLVKIGEQLKVDLVIDGRIQQIGKTVRVTLQAVSVKTGDILWSDHFNGAPDRLLNLQDLITERLAFHISKRLEHAYAGALGKQPTENPEAYENYLKARFFWQKRSYDSMKNAVLLYEKAIELDPQFTAAYIGLADSLFLIYDYSYDSNVELVDRSKDQLAKAIGIDPGQAEAYTTLGLIRTYDREWEKAESAFSTALSLDPDSPDALHRYAMLLLKFREFDRAESMMRHALEYEPNSPGINMNLGVILYYSGKHDAALEQFDRSLEFDASFVSPLWYSARCLWDKGEKAAAMKKYAGALRLSDSKEIAEMIESGMNKEDIDTILARWIKIWEKNNFSVSSIAILASHRKDKELTLRLIDQAVESRHPWAMSIYAQPEFTFLHKEPRFQELLRKQNLLGHKSQ